MTVTESNLNAALPRARARGRNRRWGGPSHDHHLVMTRDSTPSQAESGRRPLGHRRPGSQAPGRSGTASGLAAGPAAGGPGPGAADALAAASLPGAAPAGPGPRPAGDSERRRRRGPLGPGLGSSGTARTGDPGRAPPCQ